MDEEKKEPVTSDHRRPTDTTGRKESSEDEIGYNGSYIPGSWWANSKTTFVRWKKLRPRFSEFFTKHIQVWRLYPNLQDFFGLIFFLMHIIPVGDKMKIVKKDESKMEKWLRYFSWLKTGLVWDSLGIKSKSISSNPFSISRDSALYIMLSSSSQGFQGLLIYVSRIYTREASGRILSLIRCLSILRYENSESFLSPGENSTYGTSRQFHCLFFPGSIRLLWAKGNFSRIRRTNHASFFHSYIGLVRV